MLTFFIRRMTFSMCDKMRNIAVISAICAISFSFASGVSAQEGKPPLDGVRDTATQAVKDGAASQKRIDTFDNETSQIVQEYRAALIQLESLREYNAQLEKLIKAQEKEMRDIRQQIEDVTAIDRTIIPHMFRMIDGLETFVELDTPFFINERRARVQGLRALMDRSDANPAEKYRKILEAFEIENEYGRTIEAYEGELELEGETRTVNFLRLGRVTWIYQTLDGDESAVWNRVERRWVDLDGDFDSEIRTGIRVAREQVTPNLLIVPMFGANGGNE